MRQPWQMREDVRQRLGEYQAAHTKKINRACHFVGIPAIMFGIIGFVVTGNHSRDPLAYFCGWLMSCVLVSLVIHLVLNAGFRGWLVVVMAYGMFRGATALDPHECLILSALLFVIGWIIQILGHHFSEGNRPQFLTSFGQAFEAAPLHFIEEVETLFFRLF